jgi:hypothetical protein
MRLEGLGKLKKNQFTSSGLDPATFRLLAQYLNHYASAFPRTRIGYINIEDDDDDDDEEEEDDDDDDS